LGISAVSQKHILCWSTQTKTYSLAWKYGSGSFNFLTELHALKIRTLTLSAQLGICCASNRGLCRNPQSTRHAAKPANQVELLEGHPNPAIEGHLKTGHSNKSKADVDAGQKTSSIVASLTPDVSCHRASLRVKGHKHEIVREPVTSLETTEAGKSHQVFGKARWPGFE
jgi:hypothetical protein